MEIGVLGPVVMVADDGEPVVQRSALQRLLLAVLIAARGRAVPTDELVESLWFDALPADPVGALQSQVSRLRRQLGPAAAWLETVSAGYRISWFPDRLDAARFERLLDEARQFEHEPALALGRLDRALVFWRGRAYQDLADRPAIAPEATRLDELRAEAVELRADMLLALGRPAEAASAMELLTAEQPFRERPVAVLMRALTADGRQVEALRAFERFRTLLGDELGLEPSPDLRALETTILRHEASMRPLVPAVGVPGNSFVGRDAEVAKVAWLLEQGRLVTLTGPGGVGKTRIALHVAADVRPAYPDGVYLCELAGVSDLDAVIPAVASMLRVEQPAERSLLDRVIEFLHLKRALVVIDNCEHVLPAVAELVAAILLRTSHVDVLATSRERLGVDGEHRVPVGPLRTPAWDDPTAPSVVLFTDRARAVRPDFTLLAVDVPAVSELCRHLNGLPLAIELAAAQTVSASPSSILAAVKDRIDGLADPRRTVERHRSLDVVFGWSYGLLGSAQREVFERLAVFAGGWTAAAASDVAHATAADLAALVECSLVTPRFGSDVRFVMLEPIRQFAEARLSDRRAIEPARRQHAAWAVELAEAADTGLRSPDEAAWRAVLDTELDNLRAAHLWCLDHDQALSIRLVGSFFRYVWSGAPSEVSAWAAQAVSRFPDSSHPRLPVAYAVASIGRCFRGDLGAARGLAETAIAKAMADPLSARFAWEVLGDIETWLGNFDRAVPCYDRAVELARLAGDDHQAAISLLDRAVCPSYSGRADEAIAECDATAPLVSAMRNPTLDAWSDYMHGEIRLDHAPLEALPYLRRSVATARRIGNRTIAGVAGLSVVSCEARFGDPDQALTQYGALIDHWYRLGAWNMQWTTLRTLIELLARLGRDREAAQLYGAMTTSPTASPLVGADGARIADAVTTMRTRLGDERFEALRDQGSALSDAEAVAFALECASGAN